MKKYTKPSLEAVAFECEDIITASAEPRFVKDVTGNETIPVEFQWTLEWN